MIRPRSRCRRATGRGISTFIPVAAGCTPSRRRARPRALRLRCRNGAAGPSADDLHPAARFAGSNFCSEILVSADGRFVYAGNRLHDSIAIFSVGSNGELTYVGEEWTRGNYPRSFNFDPTGQFLYCCNQRGDNVAVFRVNRHSGRLDFHRPLHPRRQPFDHRLPRSCEAGLMRHPPVGEAKDRPREVSCESDSPTSKLVGVLEIAGVRPIPSRQSDSPVSKLVGVLEFL